MKEYCVDLELAKELKENGFPQENTYFFYEYFDEAIKDFVVKFERDYSCLQNYISAPTSDEILKELPQSIHNRILTSIKTGVAYQITYGYPHNGILEGFHPFEANRKLSNALAKMWLHLKKGGYIK